MDNKDKFTLSVRITTKSAVRCIHCECVRQEHDMPLDQFVAKAGLIGWRYVKSAKLRREGPMCPECSDMIDDMRGDDE